MAPGVSLAGLLHFLRCLQSQGASFTRIRSGRLSRHACFGFSTSGRRWRHGAALETGFSSQQPYSSWTSTAKALVGVQLKRFLLQHGLKHGRFPKLVESSMKCFETNLPRTSDPRMARVLLSEHEQLKKNFVRSQICVLIERMRKA